MNLLSRQSHHFLNTKISLTGHEDNIQAYSLISGNLRYHFLPLGHHHLLSSLALRILETLDHASCAALHHTRYSSVPHLLPLSSYILPLNNARITNGTERKYLDHCVCGSGKILIYWISKSEVRLIVNNAWLFSQMITDFERMFDKSVIFIFPVCLLTVTWNIPKFFEFKTCYLPLKVMGKANISIIISFLLKKYSSNQSYLEEESGKFRGSQKKNALVKT